MQDWIVEMVKRMVQHLPIAFLMRMGLALIFRPRTHHWSKARDAINDYVHEQEAKQRHAIGLDRLVAMAKAEAEQPLKHAAE